MSLGEEEEEGLMKGRARSSRGLGGEVREEEEGDDGRGLEYSETRREDGKRGGMSARSFGCYWLLV